MPKDTKEKKYKKKEDPKVPPDVFDDASGVKVFISDEELKKNTGKESATKDEILDEGSNEEVEEQVKEDEKVEAEKDEEVLPPSFYEKVLGEKPPKKSESEDDDEKEEKEGLNRSLFFLGGVVFIMTIIIATVVGLILFNTFNSKVAEVKKQADATPTQIPTPTTVQISKEDITFEVLNGSGESGKAGKTADAIKALGYTAEKVGNADSKDYSGFEVGFSKDISQDEVKVIMADLKKEFINVKESGEIVPESTDVLVVVGK